MNNNPNIPKALMSAPIQVPQDISWAVDPGARVARIMYRRQLDLAHSIADIPWWVLKALATTVISMEADMERQGVPFPHLQASPNPNAGNPLTKG